MAKQGGRALRIIGFIALAAFLLYFWHHPLLTPVKLFVVLAHELGHAAAALLTGGEVLEISIGADQGGWARTRGGWTFIVLNAGYLGSTLAGIALITAGRSPRGARLALSALATLLAAVAVFWMTWWTAAQAYTALMAVGFLIAGRFAPLAMQRFFLQGLGLFSVLYALWDIADDVLTPGRGAGSDAAMLAEMTYIPTVCWGISWIVASIGLVFVLRRRIF